MNFRAICQKCKNEFPIIDAYDLWQETQTSEPSSYFTDDDSQPIEPESEPDESTKELRALGGATIHVRERTKQKPWAEIVCPKCRYLEAFDCDV